MVELGRFLWGGGKGIMRRVNEFFGQDVKLRSNRSKEEYPPPPCVKGDNG